MSGANPILDQIWAKSAPAGGSGETLLAHTAAVVESLARIARLRPTLHTESRSPRLWHWAFWGCCLHDAGKTASGFQAQLRTSDIWGHRHEVLSLAFLDHFQPRPDDAPWIAAAVASHHKDAAPLETRYPVDLQVNDPLVKALVDDIPASVLEPFSRELLAQSETLRVRLGFDELGVEPLVARNDNAEAFFLRAPQAMVNNLKAFYRFAYSLKNGDCSEIEVVASLLLRGLVITADHTASAHAIPPSSTLAGVEDLRSRLDLKAQALYQHQRECESASGSTILTAPTGSGKTESSLLWAANQKEGQIGKPRVFYVLPFQASMNAMHQRLEKTFKNEVGLQHSRSLHTLYRRYLETESTPTQAARLAKWARNLSKLHAYPVRVLSPYQLLKAFYRLRGYETLLTDCFGGLFIFDEMHAYEPARLAMILGMAGFLSRRFSARFCIMTATMPPPLIARVRDVLGPHLEIAASHELAQSFKRHRLRLVPGEICDPANLGHIATAARTGQSVLVCCNTVRRARDVRSALSALLPQTPLALLHSRFTARDRTGKENDLVGDGSKLSKPRGVLVATQVVEVSLNLDFDTIFTEPAPVEALLQRFGRVNRLGGRRDLTVVNVFNEPLDGQRIYDPAMIQETIRALEPANGLPVDNSLANAWLDQIYQGRILEDWSANYERSLKEFEDVCLDTLHAFDCDDNLEEQFYKAFDSIDVLPAVFAKEYENCLLDDPMLASELLVSIRWSQYARLAKKGLVQADRERWQPPIVHAEYTSDDGLIL